MKALLKQNQQRQKQIKHSCSLNFTKTKIGGLFDQRIGRRLSSRGGLCPIQCGQRSSTNRPRPKTFCAQCSSINATQKHRQRNRSLSSRAERLARKDCGLLSSLSFTYPGKHTKISSSRSFAFWRNALLETARESSNDAVSSTPNTLIVHDKFPKSKFHYLVLPKDTTLETFNNLTKDHVPLLREMEQAGQDFIKTNHPGISFKLGFHSLPSLLLVHMHVISTDFQSELLKNKKHWNSFNTPFFVPVGAFIDNLERDGKIQVNLDQVNELLKSDLMCCNTSFKTIPKLKKHLETEHPRNHDHKI